MMELLGSTEDNIALGFVSLPLARKIRSEYFCLKLQLKEQIMDDMKTVLPAKTCGA